MRNIKKTFIVCLVFIMIISSTMMAYGNVSGTSVVSYTQNIVDKVSEMLPGLCKNVNGTLYLGEKINVYRISSDGVDEIDYEMYPVLSDNEIIAFARVVKNEFDVPIVSCSTTFAEELQNVREHSKSDNIALVFAEDGAYAIVSGQEPVIIHEMVNSELKNIEDIGRARNSIIYSEIKIMEVLNVQPQTRIMEEQRITLSFVGNGSVGCSTCDPIGLCWAAATAMVTNHYYGTSHNCSTIHSLAGCLSVASSPANFKTLMGNLGLIATGPNYNFIYSDAVTMTESNRLGFMRLERTKSNGSVIGHRVVTNGYYYNTSESTTRYFYYIDPNSGQEITEFPLYGTLYVPSGAYEYEFDYYLECYRR